MCSIVNRYRPQARNKRNKVDSVPKKKKLVADVMTKDVVTADMSIDISDAIKILHSL